MKNPQPRPEQKKNPEPRPQVMRAYLSSLERYSRVYEWLAKR
jgi:hypothetical protein